MHVKPMRQRFMADARKDQGLVGVLGGIGLVRKNLKSFLEVALFTESLYQLVVVVDTVSCGGD